MQEEPAEPYFHFSAALRIHGEGLDFDAITTALGLQPTHVHKKGDSRRPGGPPYQDDAWHYAADLPEDAPLDAHLQALWADVAPARQFLLALKHQHRVDVFAAIAATAITQGFK